VQAIKAFTSGKNGGKRLISPGYQGVYSGKYGWERD
jgi:hypothetical protein